MAAVKNKDIGTLLTETRRAIAEPAGGVDAACGAGVREIVEGRFVYVASPAGLAGCLMLLGEPPPVIGSRMLRRSFKPQSGELP
jgi:hypothetical protein